LNPAGFTWLSLFGLGRRRGGVWQIKKSKNPFGHKRSIRVEEENNISTSRC
jgi:hypothetical protein